MTYEFALIEKKEHLWIITLNRPERMNALHSPAHKELDKIFNEFQEDSDAWVAIITGSGERAFSAGNDLKQKFANSINLFSSSATIAIRIIFTAFTGNIDGHIIFILANSAQSCISFWEYLSFS